MSQPREEGQETKKKGAASRRWPLLFMDSTERKDIGKNAAQAFVFFNCNCFY